MAILAALGAPAAHAGMNPAQFMQRFLAEANAAFNPPAPRHKPATQRPQVPLDEIPMPRLSPEAPTGALGFAADPKPIPTPTVAPARLPR